MPQWSLFLKAEFLLHKDTLISKFSWSKAAKLITRSKIADYYEYLIFFFKKMLSFVKYPYIAAPSCHLYSYLSPSPFCLWVSDSSSLPVTARCLDFELVLFTPLSVVVVVIVVALRQTGRCNGKLRLSLNSRLQRLVFRLAGYFQRKSLVWRTGFFVYHQGWERNLVDLLTHFWHFYWFL